MGEREKIYEMIEGGKRQRKARVSYRVLHHSTYIVNVEEESIVNVLRGLLVTEPVQFVYKRATLS